MSRVPPYDDAHIAGRRPAIKVIECPCCGKQAALRIVRRLPKGYDDPNNPVSMYPPDQVGWIDTELTWA